MKEFEETSRETEFAFVFDPDIDPHELGQWINSYVGTKIPPKIVRDGV